MHDTSIFSHDTGSQRLGLDDFMRHYKANLITCVTANPSNYRYGISDIDEICHKMQGAILDNTYSKDGLAFKMTCKQLGIKHTYQAIKEYIEQ